MQLAAVRGLPNLSGLRVLVVEDDEDSRELLQELLTFQGATVEAAADAFAGFDAALRFQPTVLVSDIGLPGQDGYAFLRRVRQLSTPLRDLPAIAVTAWARPEDRARSRAAGFDAHLVKPVDMGLLLSTIAGLSAARTH